MIYVHGAPEGQHPVPSAQAVCVSGHWPMCRMARLAVVKGAAGRRNSMALTSWLPRRIAVAQWVYIVYVYAKRPSRCTSKRIRGGINPVDKAETQPALVGLSYNPLFYSRTVLVFAPQVSRCLSIASTSDVASVHTNLH